METITPNRVRMAATIGLAWVAGKVSRDLFDKMRSEVMAIPQQRDPLAEENRVKLVQFVQR